MGLMEDLSPGPIGLDACLFIYFIEEHPRFLPLVDPIFAAIAAGTWTAATSVLTLLEVLVAPYRAGDAALADRYEALLTRSRGLRLVEIDRPLLRSAALLRATAARLRTPDALQVAAALSTGCRTFVTNDRAIPAIAGLRVVHLSGYVAG